MGKKSNGALHDILRKQVTWTGRRPIMFDRYAGDNNTKLQEDQKLYLNERNEICLPKVNVMSFFTAQLTRSAPKVVYGKLGSTWAQALSSCLALPGEELIPFLRNGKPIVFGAFDSSGKDASSLCFVAYHTARMQKGKLIIPNPKSRPVLPVPWSLKFEIEAYPHEIITEDGLLNLMQKGGALVGVGTFRPVYGSFEASWE